MSLVGTRPPTVDEWELYEPHHRARMSFRPGLTGMWQVSGRSNITDFEEVVKLDTQYMEFATASLHNSFYFVEAKNIIHDRPMVAKNFENLVNELLRSDNGIYEIDIVDGGYRCLQQFQKDRIQCIVGRTSEKNSILLYESTGIVKWIDIEMGCCYRYVSVQNFGQTWIYLA